ncbi:putative lipoprotein [Burkholderia cepacia]|nr:putative lipoprotein [Burkholderia cepacia]
MSTARAVAFFASSADSGGCRRGGVGAGASASLAAVEEAADAAETGAAAEAAEAAEATSAAEVPEAVDAPDVALAGSA